MGSPLKRMKHQHERDIPLSKADVSWLIQQAEKAKQLETRLTTTIKTRGERNDRHKS